LGRRIFKAFCERPFLHRIIGNWLVTTHDTVGVGRAGARWLGALPNVDVGAPNIQYIAFNT